MKKILFITEKPSVAKSLALVLNKTDKSVLLSSLSKYNPVYSFIKEYKGQKYQHLITSVTGHVKEFVFEGNSKDWKSIDSRDLLISRNIIQQITETKMDICKNIQMYSNDIEILFLWLDCDREGESIAFEVIDLVKEIKPNVDIFRAIFSSLTSNELTYAYENPERPNIHLKEAVNARIEIDLRSGSAFTILQSMLLQKSFPDQFNNKIISYGPCQFPTLSFIVNRYLQNSNFINTNFWFLDLNFNINGNKLSALWNRKNIYDINIVKILFELSNNNKLEVYSVINKKSKRLRPLPLNTLDLQKNISKYFGLSSSDTMKIAEGLYNKGLISYPRTETQSFPQKFDFKEVINEISLNSEYSSYSKFLLENNINFSTRVGIKNDKSHPPIYPVKNFDGDRLSIEFKVYDLISRFFLASCSNDLIYEEKTIILKLASELFTISGQKIIENNFLSILMPFYNFKSKTIPDLLEGMIITDYLLEIKEGKTSPPKLLSESDLLTLMDKNGIGTDATMHDHIKTIQDRNYAINKNGTFKPTQLGIALIESYRTLDIPLIDPINRSQTEIDLQKISKGIEKKEVIIQKWINKIDQSFLQLNNDKEKFIKNFKEIFKKHYNLSKIELNENTSNIVFDNKLKRISLLSLECSCKKGHLILINSPKIGYFCGCSLFPKCTKGRFLTKKFTELIKLDHVCEYCKGELFKDKIIKEEFCIILEKCPNSITKFLNKIN